MNESNVTISKKIAHIPSLVLSLTIEIFQLLSKKRFFSEKKTHLFWKSMLSRIFTGVNKAVLADVKGGREQLEDK